MIPFSSSRYSRLVALGLAGVPVLAFASDGAGAGSLGLTERMMHLVIQIGVILFAARVGNMAFEKCRLPGVLGELCIGVLIGPSLLGGSRFPGCPGLSAGCFLCMT